MSYAKVIIPLSSFALIAWRIEVPIRPKPITEIFLNINSINNFLKNFLIL